MSKIENLVEVKNLKESFNINTGMFSSKPLKAVDDVSFAIRKGETLGLVGESGCGKTTVGRTILHLYKPTSGEIIYEGNKITEKNIGNAQFFHICAYMHKCLNSVRMKENVFIYFFYCFHNSTCLIMIIIS